MMGSGPSGIWLSLGASAGIHLAVLVWLVTPSHETPQIAGDGATIGLSSGMAVTSEDTDAAESEADTQDEPEPLDDQSESPPIESVDERPSLPDRAIATAPQKTPQVAAASAESGGGANAARPLMARQPAAAHPKINRPARPQQASSAAASSAPSSAAASSAKGNAASNNYAGKVMQHLGGFRRPNAVGPGSAFVSFTVAANGRLGSSSISKSSRSARFDRDALKMVRRAAPFPKPPPGVNREFSVEIEGQ